MHTYFKKFEAQEPNFTAKMWIGNAWLGSQAFKGRSTDEIQYPIPMSSLLEVTDPSFNPIQASPLKKQKTGSLTQTGAENEDPPLVNIWPFNRRTSKVDKKEEAQPGEVGKGGVQDFLMVKEGEGRLYYRVGLTYSLKDLWQSAMARGFNVSRKYSFVGAPGEVVNTTKLTTVRAGCQVQVTVTFVVQHTRHHVAVVDFIPAGLEPEIPNLKKKRNETSSGWSWYDHRQFREARVEMFTMSLWPGSHTLEYIATAVTPGSYVCPPATAEEMYNPDVFGNSDAHRLEVIP